MLSEDSSVLEDVEFSILVLYKKDMGIMAKENKRKIYVLDNIEFLIFNFDLGDISKEEVYCH